MLPAGFTELLAKTIDDIAKDAEERIAAHFTHHSLKNGSGWVAQGIDHAVEFCPFCGQNIQGLPLIAAYKTVFSDGYKALRVDLATTKATISKTFGDTALARLDTVAEQHKGSVEFWGKYCALDTAALAYPTSIVNTVKILGSVALALMERKERDPLERMDVDDAFLNAIATYEVEKNKIDAFNQAVRSANALISEKKTEAISADVTAATTELTHLKTINVRHSQVVAKLCNDHMKITGEKNNIEKQKNTIRDQLNKHTESVVKPYQARINDLLDAFNADFTIAETKHSYTGGVATSSYQLVINQTAIDIGGGNTPNHTPSFKNTLSAGDRSTLALAFFLAYLERDGGLSRKIVVFDDPFNSQDAFRRRQTILEIMKIASKCAQVIVLSHDATFLKQVWDKCPPAERSALNLSNHGTIGSKITAFDLDKACQGRTATDIDDLQSYVATRAGAHIDVIRKMRVVLETYMRSTYSADFGDVDYLGEIVGKIRKGATEHPAAALYDELNGINDYTAPYHHGENVADATPDVIDATELFGFVRKTLRIVNALQA
jgi:wobble nucleotide-excising tRNase